MNFGTVALLLLSSTALGVRVQPKMSASGTAKVAVNNPVEPKSPTLAVCAEAVQVILTVSAYKVYAKEKCSSPNDFMTELTRRNKWFRKGLADLASHPDIDKAYLAEYTWDKCISSQANLVDSVCDAYWPVCQGDAPAGGSNIRLGAGAWQTANWDAEGEDINCQNVKSEMVGSGDELRQPVATCGGLWRPVAGCPVEKKTVEPKSPTLAVCAEAVQTILTVSAYKDHAKEKCSSPNDFMTEFTRRSKWFRKGLADLASHPDVDKAHLAEYTWINCISNQANLVASVCDAYRLVCQGEAPAGWQTANVYAEGEDINCQNVKFEMI